MDDDDDFGNLYTDFGVDGVTRPADNSSEPTYEDEDALLYGPSSSSASRSATGTGTGTGSGRAPLAQSSVAVEQPDGMFHGSPKEAENEEILLYGQLYGDSAQESRSSPQLAAGSNGHDGMGARATAGQDGAPRGIQLGASAAAGPSLGASSGGHGAASAPDGEDGDQPWESEQNGVAEQQLFGEQGKSRLGNSDKADDWDSESEDDDFKIVLNTSAEAYADGEGDGENEEEEDEGNLVIVASKEAGEGKEWEESPPASPGQVAAVASAATTPAEAAGVPGEEKGGTSKTAAAVASPRIGYSGQGYHAQQPHHAQFKYVRQGAKAGGPQTPATSAAAGGRAPAGEWLAPGSAGRGESNGAGGGPRRAGQPRGGNRYGNDATGSQAFLNYLDFNLPPTKTVFDIDVDSLEDKPWRRTGVDITDYFNYGFDEMSWKHYCRRLSKVRVEATMQSKIRVYESGRSEQAYDPDLPPELAAAAGMLDAFGDSKNMQERGLEGNAGSGPGARLANEGGGRGAAWLHAMQPTGRAIQVEGGGAERRPSVDVRRQRTRDSDAVIQIMPQDAEEDNDVPLQQDEAAYLEERDVNEGAAAEPELQSFGPANDMWDRDPSVLGAGAPGASGHRRDMDGSRHLLTGGMIGPHQGPIPGYAVLPGEQFCLPPLGRGASGRRLPYGGPRPGALLAGGPRQDTFGLRHPDFIEPSRRVAAPLFPSPQPGHLKQPGHMPMGDDEPSNGGSGGWGRRGVLGAVKETENSRPWESDDFEDRDSGAIRSKLVGYHEEDEHSGEQEHKRSQGLGDDADDLEEQDVDEPVQYPKRQKTHELSDKCTRSGREYVPKASSRKNSASQEDSGCSLELSNDRCDARDESSGSDGGLRVGASKHDSQVHAKKDYRQDKRERSVEMRKVDDGRLETRGNSRQREERDRKSELQSRREKQEGSSHTQRRDFDSSYRSKSESAQRRSDDVKGTLENGERSYWSQKKDTPHEVPTSASERGRVRESGRSASRRDDSRGKEGPESDDQAYSKHRNGWTRGSEREHYVHSRYPSRRNDDRSSQPGGLSGRESARESGRESARESGRESARESGRETARESGRETARESGRETARESGRETARESGRETVREFGRETIRESGRETTRESGRKAARESGRDSARESGRDSARESGRDSARESGRDSARESVRDSARESGRESARDLGRESARELGRESTRESAQESGRDVARDSGRESVREASRKAARELGRESVRDSGREVVRDSGREVARDSGRESVQESGRESIRESTRESVDHYRSTDTRPSKEDKGIRISGRKADDKAVGVDSLEDFNVDTRRKRKIDSLHSTVATEKAVNNVVDDYQVNGLRGRGRRRGQEFRKKSSNDLELVTRDDKVAEGSSSGKTRHQIVNVSARARKKVVGKVQESNVTGRQASETRGREWSDHNPGALDTLPKKGVETAESGQVEKKQEHSAAEDRKERLRRKFSESRKPQSENNSNQTPTVEVKQERPARKRRWGSD